MLPNKHSFRFVSEKQSKDHSFLSGGELLSKINNNLLADNSSTNKVEDSGKRTFLKLAGIAGLGILASQVFPKKAEAYVMGSTPTSNVVGVKNSSNVRIDPATEGGNLASIKTNTDNLAGIKTAADAIKTNSDKFTFVGDSLKTTSSGTGVEVVGIKDASDVRMTPATDENIILLRRIAKISESLATIDSSQRQRVAVEAMPSTTVTGTLTGVTTVTTVTSMTQLAGVDARFLYIDTARNAYANGIRNNL
jgi:hypothetical protein